LPRTSRPRCSASSGCFSFIGPVVRVVDSHVHFWRIGGPGQTWPDAAWPLLYRDFGPAELLEATRTAPASIGSGADVQGVVLVQSQPDDRDTDWMLEVAADTALVKAIVGWVDLASPSAPSRIAHLGAQPKLRGLRPMLQSIEDTQWILKRELEPALHTMSQHGLRFDALVQPRHLPTLMELARRWPKLPIVIDHGAKPRVALGELEPWRIQMAQLSLYPNIHCKLSGLRTEQAADAASAELAPYVRCLVECFADRLMWGSDWPVLLHSRDRYSDWLHASMRLVEQAGVSDLESLFSRAAERFYGLV
jgi:L-fuconolactonase